MQTEKQAELMTWSANNWATRTKLAKKANKTDIEYTVDGDVPADFTKTVSANEAKQNM